MINKSKRYLMGSLLLAAGLLYGTIVQAQPSVKEDLTLDSLPTAWDEAMPLGNGFLGSLVWRKGDRLRISLDRADLWDLRPMKGLHRKEFSYSWIHAQVLKGEYGKVQEYFDNPYNDDPAPSKIPGAALEFPIDGLGPVRSVHLYLADARCEVAWERGATLQTFVEAARPVGWFRWEHIDPSVFAQLIAPKYSGAIDSLAKGNVAGDDLALLGYRQGSLRRYANSIEYLQQGWGGMTYTVSVRWKAIDAHTIEGSWSITVRYPGLKTSVSSVRSGEQAHAPVGLAASAAPNAHGIAASAAPGTHGMAAPAITAAALRRGFHGSYEEHRKWWKKFWDCSMIKVPDTILEKQWYLEQYKFGSAARRGAPPISLQAVWTADNGRLPPWKGDFHHDLNTQLSYWPCYSGNHLEEGLSYLDHLDANKANYRRFTKLFFGRPGLAVPGVTTLDGTEMGGWCQYSLSPTVVAWLGQHYYLQWRYSMDRRFLKDRAWPWIREAAIFLESMTTARDSIGKRELPMSSSPEINDNSITAWFPQNTNYDLALMNYTFRNAAELATELGLTSQAAHWKKILSEMGDYALTGQQQLMFAPSMAYNQSHRHFSNMMAIHPLGLIKWEDGDRSQTIIKNSIALLDSIGPVNWCGYSYSWLANIKARAKDGAGAARDLQIFAKAFCSSNSFHVNGDQTGTGYSGFTYRPFTLEGNFAFAAGLQEMLLQSYAGFIEIAPAVPEEWKDFSFENLRAEGAFLVSAKKQAGRFTEIRIVSQKGGRVRLKLPFSDYVVADHKNMLVKDEKNGFLQLSTLPGGRLVLKKIKGQGE